jgi:hypothetical protein
MDGLSERVGRLRLDRADLPPIQASPRRGLPDRSRRTPSPRRDLRLSPGPRSPARRSVRSPSPPRAASPRRDLRLSPLRAISPIRVVPPVRVMTPPPRGRAIERAEAYISPGSRRAPVRMSRTPSPARGGVVYVVSPRAASPMAISPPELRRLAPPRRVTSPSPPTPRRLPSPRRVSSLPRQRPASRARALSLPRASAERDRSHSRSRSPPLVSPPRVRGRLSPSSRALAYSPPRDLPPAGPAWHEKREHRALPRVRPPPSPPRLRRTDSAQDYVLSAQEHEAVRRK